MIVRGNEGVFIVVLVGLECWYLSVCQRVDVSGLPTVWCEIIGGWDCDKVIVDLVQHDKATVDASLISVISSIIVISFQISFQSWRIFLHNSPIFG